MTTLLTPTQTWTCPNCTLEEQTHEARPHTRFHACRGLRGLTAPMVPAGTKCKVESHEREDYIGENPMLPEVRNGKRTGRMVPAVPLDANGRPVMSVTTTRDDGQDVVVFASTSVVKAKEL